MAYLSNTFHSPCRNNCNNLKWFARQIWSGVLEVRIAVTFIAWGGLKAYVFFLDWFLVRWDCLTETAKYAQIGYSAGGIIIKYVGCWIRVLEFKYWCFHLKPMWPWIRYWNSLYLSFIFQKRGPVIVTTMWGLFYKLSKMI